MAAQSSATWCVCKKGGADKVLQQAIDYACGNGGDCTQTHQGGKCFNPDTIFDHCNYAVNSYFQNKRQAPGSCDFSGAAMVVTTDPSSNGCVYPTSASTTGTTNTRSPGSSFGNNVGVAGVRGLGPSASDDVSHGGVRVHQRTNIFVFLAIVCAGVMMVVI
ncbi:hypothetical protein L1987_80225 [Smallanthus sonchifolius]|uniref:Uncharacterized protein n=1 Tax=Smallanthus sonchifolius TaxID=185202 RepID=A0ACB8YN51_9ASTR|nr:hypothetical protein L1987_80225 [Smallanthus sonchifolius]